MTTALDRYREMKRRDPDTLLIFREQDGDYTLYRGDAERVSGLLDLAIDSIRDGSEGVMVGRFRASSLEANLAKLVAAGYRAAVLERVTAAPKGAPVERIVTDGTLAEG